MNSIKYILALLVSLSIIGCVDTSFDEPTGGVEIDDSKVVSIGSVLSKFSSGSVVALEDDAYLKGTVVSDDASGNFYKIIVFQDESGGMSVAADQNELNAAYPVGSTIYVKLKGLTLAYNNKLPQLGLGVDGSRVNRIPDALVSEYLLSGGSGDAVVPQKVTISELNGNINKYLNTLVQIENVEFDAGILGLNYASPETEEGPRADNRTVVDCDGNEIIIRNSDFSSFATKPLPLENGTLTAVVSVYGSTNQLFIRDEADVKFDGERCDGSGGSVDNEITIESIKKRYYDLGADKSETGFIKALVVSDQTVKVVNNRNAMVQAGGHGILVRFSSPHSFNIGDEVKINVSGQELSEYNSTLQINNVPVVNATKLSSGNELMPISVTLEELTSNFNRYESALIKVEGTLPSGKKFSDSDVNLTNGDASIKVYTPNSATFASESVPGGEVTVTGIAAQYKDVLEIILNGADGIEGGSTGGGGGGGTGGGDEVSIGSVKDAFYNQGASNAPDGFITGVVISDKNSGQINAQNAIIQNGEDGILVRFKGEHSLNQGDVVKIDISQAELSEYKALLQINKVELDNASVTGQGELPTPSKVTISEILANPNKYESTRLLLEGVSLSSSEGTFTANVTIKDNTGEIGMYIGNGASFSGESLPSGNVNVTCVGSAYNSPQVQIYKRSDVE